MTLFQRSTAPAYCLHAAVACAVLSAVSLFSASLPAAAAYPERPIRIIVPFPPGGASDVIARMFADKFAQTWGVTAVVDNRTGASGIIGTDIVAKAPADGYTLGMVALSFAINPAIHKLPYDSDRDFTFVTIAASNPLVLVTNPQFPVRSVKELIDLAKSKPDSVSFASSGTGTSPHMSAELFKLMTGVKMLHVPYKGSTAAHPDLFAGRVNVMFDTLIATLPHIKGGRLKTLGITSKTRSTELPDLAPIADTVPGYESTSWVVLMGPAKIPTAVARKISLDIQKVVNSAGYRETMDRIGAIPRYESMEQFSAMIRNLYARNKATLAP